MHVCQCIIWRLSFHCKRMDLTNDHLLLLHKQAHDKKGIAESLHVHTNRAWLIACEVGVFLRENHNSQKYASPSPLWGATSVHHQGVVTPICAILMDVIGSQCGHRVTENFWVWVQGHKNFQHWSRSRVVQSRVKGLRTYIQWCRKCLVHQLCMLCRSLYYTRHY